MTNGSQKIRALYGLLRGGSEQPEVMNAILRLIEEDRDARRTYIHLAHMEVNLPWLVDAGAETETRILRQVQKEVNGRRRLWFWTISTSLIAVILLVGISLIRITQTQELVAPQMMAYVELDPDATIAGTPPGGRSVIIRKGIPFTLVDGSVQLRTDRQSKIILTGPLQLEMTGPNVLKLIQGTLVAHILPADIGFTVETSGSRFVDLGTKFGVSVDLAGNSQLHVFDGVVAAESSDPVSKHLRRLVEAGESVEFTATGIWQPEFTPVTNRFAAGFNRLHGILNIKGSIQHLTSPPASVEPGKLINNQFIYLIPERHTTLQEELPVVPPEAGRLAMGKKWRKQMLSTKTQCSSILLHSETGGQPTTLEGEIHFDRPILGVIFTTEGLFQSDPLFTHPSIRYPDWDHIVQNKISRGSLVSFMNSNIMAGDMIYIHPDRRTLSVKLRAMDNMDQVRIILQENHFLSP